MKYIIIISIFLVSCNPCKYVSKHPECFPSDTVIVNKETIRHEKIFIKNDSIIRDTVPCDPITKTYYKTKTVYQTKTIEKIDTIYHDRITTRINPINKVLEKKVLTLENKAAKKNKIIFALISLIILLLLIYKLIR